MINNEPKSKKKNIIIIPAVLLIIIIILVLNFNKTNKKNVSRTIMIYMVGSNLESQSGLATTDLESIEYNDMDNENINVVLIAGGSKEWKNNYINKNETSIYELTNNGFKKVETNTIQNMGDSQVFSDFINYVQKNYKTDKYDLIFWNHGGAIQGSEYDDLSNDVLSLSEMKEGLSKTKFKNNNKLETIIFRTCLNGTLEVGSTLDDYSDYLIASEEITIGTSFTSVLNFINEIKTSDTGYDVGLKFVEAYKKQIKDYKNIYAYSTNAQETLYSTYSIVKLSNIEQLTKALNDFVKDIDVTKDYNTIAKVRSNLYQYAYTQSDEPSYDMVDLYNLVDNLKGLSKNKAEKVLKEIENTVLYNWATNNQSRGISIYFPYNATEDIRELFLDIYDDFDDLNKYRNFIEKFNSIQKTSVAKYSFTENKTEVKTENKNSDFTLELTDEQLQAYAKAEYLVFEGDNGDGFYRPIYIGKNVTLDGNTLKANIKGKQLRVIDKNDRTDNGLVFTLIENSESDNVINYSTLVVMQTLPTLDEEMKLQHKIDSAQLFITLDKNTNEINTSSIIKTEENNDENILPSTVALNINDYDIIAFGSSKYNIIDNDGNYNPNFSSNGIYEGKEYKTNSFEFKLEDFNENKDYYCIFRIYDVNNNKYYSKLIKMN